MSVSPANIPIDTPAEIEAIYRRRLPQFRRVAAAIVGDREAACDAVQDAFASALRKHRSYRGSGSLEAWLWQVVLNTARNHRRRVVPTPVAEVPDRAGLIPSPADEELARAVASLPQRQREALFLRHYADLDYRSIAAALGVAEGTVAAALNAAHATLRQQLIQEVKP